MFGLKKSSPTDQELIEQWLNMRLSTALDITRFTPDIAELERSEFQRVFVYNELQQGHRSNILLSPDTSEYDSICYTDEHYILWKKRLGEASAAIAMEKTGTWTKPQWDTPDRARIQGELYVVQSSFLTQLDTYHQNTLQFERKRIKIVRPHYHTVIVPDKDSYKARGLVTQMRGCTPLMAWMYFGIEDYWSQQLSRMFCPTTMFTSKSNPWLNAYYSFTKKEYSR